MKITNFTADNMINSPRVDARTYFTLQGDIFYRQMGSKRGGVFDKYTVDKSPVDGHNVTVYDHAAIVAGRYMEFTEGPTTYYVPVNGFLGIKIDLTKINSTTGTPFTEDYSVTDNQTTIEAFDYPMNQQTYDQMKQNFMNDPLIEEIIVPIYIPYVPLQIEHPQGYSQAVQSDFESYQRVVGSSVSSVMTSHIAKTDSMLSSQVSVIDKSAAHTYSNYYDSLMTEFSNFQITTTTNINSNFDSANSSVHREVSSYYEATTSALLETGESVFESVAGPMMPPMISDGISSYLSGSGIKADMGFLTDSSMFNSATHVYDSASNSYIAGKPNIAYTSLTVNSFYEDPDHPLYYKLAGNAYINNDLRPVKWSTASGFAANATDADINLEADVNGHKVVVGHLGPRIKASYDRFNEDNWQDLLLPEAIQGINYFNKGFSSEFGLSLHLDCRSQANFKSILYVKFTTLKNDRLLIDTTVAAGTLNGLSEASPDGNFYLTASALEAINRSPFVKESFIRNQRFFTFGTSGGTTLPTKVASSSMILDTTDFYSTLLRFTITPEDLEAIKLKYLSFTLEVPLTGRLR